MGRKVAGSENQPEATGSVDSHWGRYRVRRRWPTRPHWRRLGVRCGLPRTQPSVAAGTPSPASTDRPRRINYCFGNAATFILPKGLGPGKPGAVTLAGP
jgi:hypothetical protein